jgi:Arc/MetJ-type ribon-helix-helix transcriptional regulator
MKGCSCAPQRSCLRLLTLDAIPPWWYISSMKVKTSVSLSEECLQQLDAVAGKGANRSAVIEEAVLEYIERRRRQARGRKDREIIAKNARALERDVRETLEFQAPE